MFNPHKTSLLPESLQAEIAVALGNPQALKALLAKHPDLKHSEALTHLPALIMANPALAGTFPFNLYSKNCPPQPVLNELIDRDWEGFMALGAPAPIPAPVLGALGIEDDTEPTPDTYIHLAEAEPLWDSLEPTIYDYVACIINHANRRAAQLIRKYYYTGAGSCEYNNKTMRTLIEAAVLAQNTEMLIYLIGDTTSDTHEAAYSAVDDSPLEQATAMIVLADAGRCAKALVEKYLEDRAVGLWEVAAHMAAMSHPEEEPEDPSEDEESSDGDGDEETSSSDDEERAPTPPMGAGRSDLHESAVRNCLDFTSGFLLSPGSRCADKINEMLRSLPVGIL